MDFAFLSGLCDREPVLHGKATEAKFLSGLCDRELSNSVAYQWHRGIRPVPTARVVEIERATDGAVTRKELRPNDWHLIWPELKDEAVHDEQERR